MYFFTADEHYHHAKIIQYCNRPFTSVEQMDGTLIANFNSVVGRDDVTVHAGDFGFFKTRQEAEVVIKRLHGNHIFLKGSHDRWLPDSAKTQWRRMIDGQFIVACHYAMRTWERAHYGSWQVYGHSHGMLAPIGKQWDVGVDNNQFMPVSFEQLKGIMAILPMVHGLGHDKPEEIPEIF